MRTLHELPKFEDRWSYLYLEYGTLDQTASGLIFRNARLDTAVPIDQLGLLMLGPGTSITHAAVKALALNNCLVAWVGEEGVRLYAHASGGTFSSRRLLFQAAQACDPAKRLAVVCRMYQRRFAEAIGDKSIEQVRGMEGIRVRRTYEKLAGHYGLEWKARQYDQDAWQDSSPANRALSTANACLYGLCHAAIVSGGYSAAIGFVHTGKMLSFVYDVADLYKTEITVPLAFRVAAEGGPELERRVRLACRDEFHSQRLLERILPDIKEVLGAGDDPGESAGELEGRAVTLAVGVEDGSLSGQSQPPGA